MKQILLFVFGIFIAQSSVLAQKHESEVYKFKLGVDIPVATLTIGTAIPSFILQKKAKPLSYDEINALKISDINRFDRSAVYRYNHKSEVSSDVFQYFSMVSPALLFADKKVRQDWKYILPMWIETFALTTTLTSLTKFTVKRKRPYVYNPNLPIEEKVSRNATASFFSGHTSISAASTFFVAKVYADYHPDSKWKPLMWTGAAIIPAITGLCRYGAGKHFFTDVIIGYAIGSAIGIGIPQLHKIKQKN